MELLVIPVLLSVGALLVFLGVGDTPALETIPGATYFRRPQQQRPAMNTMRAYTPPPHVVEPEEITFTDSDALLSDVLSEMMELREELKALRTRIEAIEQKEEPASPRVRRPRVEY
jgi:hypothetical protein